VTPSATATATATPTPTATATPSLTPTPILCWVFVENPDGVNLRLEPALSAPVLLAVPGRTVLTVLDMAHGDDGLVWYYARVRFDNRVFRDGWVLRDVVVELTNCPLE